MFIISAGLAMVDHKGVSDQTMLQTAPDTAAHAALSLRKLKNYG
jgi:hypothetical protein